jgi:potassium channel subfamily K
MINMLGYFLGRYPQHFSLTDDQRTLILQMTAFVVWLLIGAAFFQKVMGISFADALYFCDITVLTLGFGDVTPQTSVGRGLVWPYAVIGIIQLGLVIGSISRFAKEVHYDNVVRKHIEQRRLSTFERTVTYHEYDGAREATHAQEKEVSPPAVTYQRHRHRPIRNTIHAFAINRRPRLLVMREEKDRFDAMRAIQHETMRFRRWNDLVISIIVFGIVWSCGAVVFWQLEDMTYFEGLHFCFCSLITIGYGDFTPQSNAGRPFFVMWSLIAIPTMTILISQMTDTVVAGFKHSTERFADFFVLPRSGTYRSCLSHFPCVRRLLQSREEKQRVKRGFPVGTHGEHVGEPEDGPRSQDPEEPAPRHSNEEHPTRTIEELARESDPSPYELAQQLAFAIRRTAQDARENKRKRYTYEEWVEYTRLIQFTDPKSRRTSSAAGTQVNGDGSVSVDVDEFGVLNWDWIGENSPMLANSTEPEWILDRLCESLIRYVSTREHAGAAAQGQIDEQEVEEPTLKKERDLGIDET